MQKVLKPWNLVFSQNYHLREGYRQKQLAEFGVNVVNEPIVIDNNIITSYCPSTASGVAFALLEKLTSKEKMNVVKKAMGFKILQINSNKQSRTSLQWLQNALYIRGNNMEGIEQQLEYISSSMDSISSSIDELSENYNNEGSLAGFGFVIIIVLLCINNNIKKLTQAIRDKK